MTAGVGCVSVGVGASAAERALLAAGATGSAGFATGVAEDDGWGLEQELAKIPAISNNEAKWAGKSFWGIMILNRAGEGSRRQRER